MDDDILNHAGNIASLDYLQSMASDNFAKKIERRNKQRRKYKRAFMDFWTSNDVDKKIKEAKQSGANSVKLYLPTYAFIDCLEYADDCFVDDLRDLIDGLDCIYWGSEDYDRSAYPLEIFWRDYE